MFVQKKNDNKMLLLIYNDNIQIGKNCNHFLTWFYISRCVQILYNQRVKTHTTLTLTDNTTCILLKKPPQNLCVASLLLKI